MVRAKFAVESISKNEGGGGGGVVRLRPVVGGSAENDQFYKYTPGGSIVLDTVNDAAIAQFEGATHFYVDFTPVPAPTEAEPGASS